MQLGQRDKMALAVAGIAVALFAMFDFAIFPVWDSLQQKRTALPVQEKKLEKYREVARTAGIRNAEVISVEARLWDAEAGLLASKTSALASAELQELMKQLTAAQSIEVRSSEFLPTKPLNPEFMQVPLGVQFQCRLDQLVNLLRELRGSTKFLSVPRLQIQSTGSKEKLVNVSMQIAGIMRVEPPQKSSSN
jgi:hypothetical protein